MKSGGEHCVCHLSYPAPELFRALRFFGMESGRRQNYLFVPGLDFVQMLVGHGFWMMLRVRLLGDECCE